MPRRGHPPGLTIILVILIAMGTITVLTTIRRSFFIPRSIMDTAIITIDHPTIQFTHLPIFMGQGDGDTGEGTVLFL